MAKEEAEKASRAAEKHQKAIAKLTADNVVQLLRLKQSEASLAAATAERDALQLEVSNIRGPWYAQVSDGSVDKVSTPLHHRSLTDCEFERSDLLCQVSALPVLSFFLRGRLQYGSCGSL